MRNSEAHLVLVRGWWRSRLLAGCQLTDLPRYLRHVDYKGEGPWFETVTVEALYQDFMSSPFAAEIPDYEFMRLFRSIAPVQKRRMRSVIYRGDQIFSQVKKNYIRFKPKEVYLLDDRSML